MSEFSSPLSFRLNGGLRASPLRSPREPLEKVLGVALDLRDDLELGGAYYSYTPYPSPELGLVDALMRQNDVPGLGMAYPSRGDLPTVIRIDWFGSNWLDLGRLDWQLRAAYGDLFDAVDYSVATLHQSPSVPNQIHTVRFGDRGIPVVEAPSLECRLDISVAPGDEANARAVAESLGHAVLAVAGASPHLSVQFDSASVLDLGRYAEAIVRACSSARLLGYSLFGDLQQDGNRLRIEHIFSDVENPVAQWRASS